MCNYHHRSALRILEVVSDAGPCEVSKIKELLWEDLLDLHFGAQADLESYVGALAFEGYLKQTPAGYALTNRGKSKIQQLEVVVAAA